MIGFTLLGLAGGEAMALPADPPAIAQAAPIQGWKAFKGRGVELWLPQAYQGGSPSASDTTFIIDGIRRLGPQFEQFAQVIERDPSKFALFAIDPQPTASGGLTNVLIGVDRVPSVVTLDVMMKSVASALPSSIRVTEQKLVRLGNQPAGRLTTETAVTSLKVKQLIYLLKQGNTVWSVSFTTEASEFQKRVPLFERSIRTFKGTPIDGSQQTLNHRGS